MCMRVVSQLAPLLWSQKGVNRLTFASSSFCTSSYSILPYTPLKSLGHSVHMEVGSNDLFLRQVLYVIHVGQSVLEENTVIIMEKEASSVVIPNICWFIH